jgi:Flp pilus assembly pilin Flp
VGYPFPSQAIDSQHRSKTQRSSAGCRQASQIWPKVTGRWELEKKMSAKVFRRLWCEEDAQDIAEYAVMLAVILVIVVGTIRLIGGNANNVFSSVASSLAQ